MDSAVFVQALGFGAYSAFSYRLMGRGWRAQGLIFFREPGEKDKGPEISRFIYRLGLSHHV